jgi:protease I
MNELKGKKVAILVSNGFEQSELFEPRQALQAAGAEVVVVSLKKESVKGWNHKEWGEEIDVDEHIGAATVDEFDALVLPGGVLNPDFLRMDHRAVAFVRDFVGSGKPVAAICHGPWTLVEADVVRGKRMTSYPSLRTDLKNAGAQWVDQEVVVDGNLITSRWPEDLPAFNRALIEKLGSAPARVERPRPSAPMF